MNRRTAAGLALLAILLLASLLAPLLAPFERGKTEGLRKEVVDGEERYFFAPERPGPRHPLGTDRYGYDMLTEMLHGLKWTLAAVFGIAVLRAGFAFLLGLAAVGRRGGLRRRRSFSPLAAFPSFVVAYLLLFRVTINSPLPAFSLFLYQATVVALLDLPGVARSFAAKARSVAASSFVEAARSAGADSRWIAARHVAPFLADDFFEAIPVQAVATAAFIAKLGLFSLFIGGTTLSLDPVLLQPSRMELVGLMGYHNGDILGAPWLFLGPFAGWLLVFTAAELLSSGLRRRRGGPIR
ncbi:MAG: hypothetical protein JNG85_02920 [Spirochaetaceae bacterium]|nr:hypothetical protein [Spirochaetaceae bacterium]